MLEYNLFRGAKISFPESNVLKMELTKTTLSEDAADELIRILYKNFHGTMWIGCENPGGVCG